MTLGFLLEFIPRRMRELGHGNKYMLKFREVIVPANGTTFLNGGSGYNYYCLENVAASSEVYVRSRNGLTDFSIDTNDQIYEHEGKIKLTNRSPINAHLVKFIQAIPTDYRIK